MDTSNIRGRLRSELLGAFDGTPAPTKTSPLERSSVGRGMMAVLAIAGMALIAIGYGLAAPAARAETDHIARVSALIQADELSAEDTDYLYQSLMALSTRRQRLALRALSNHGRSVSTPLLEAMIMRGAEAETLDVPVEHAGTHAGAAAARQVKRAKTIRACLGALFTNAVRHGTHASPGTLGTYSSLATK